MIITGGKFKGRKIITPDEKITRPTLSKTRESVFNILFSLIDFEGKTFLDLFAGSGIMALEALSRGFEDATCLEKNFKTLKILKSNFLSLNLKPPIIVGDSIKLLPKLQKKFDVIYIDPPYKSGLYELCLKIIKEHNILNQDGIIILEHSENIDFGNFRPIVKKNYSQKFITFLVE